MPYFSFFKIERLILIIVILLSSLKLYSQENKIVKTDSSVIEIKYFNYLNSMWEFNRLNDRRKIYYKNYALNTGVLIEEGVIENHDFIGIWNFYSPNGVLIKQIDYTTGEKIYLNGQTEMYDSLFFAMRKRADSIVISNFGEGFFKQHTQLNASNCSYHGKGM